MSVDLGSEWMKIAIVKPGVPMEIVLNRESRRKTPVAVCLKENERLFEDGALGVGILGKTLDNPQVALYQKRFPEHQLEKDEVRGTVLYRVSDELRYSPEEILGMVLNYSRSLAQEFAEQPIKDVVITVPAFFNQAERRAVLQAAQMADLKVLQLINDNTAVALNYGVFRRKDINSTAQNVMFYDMGSESTVATIVTYQSVKTKDAGTQPQLQIRGVGPVQCERDPTAQEDLQSWMMKISASCNTKRVDGSSCVQPLSDPFCELKVESVFETIVEEKDEESTLTKLGNTISSLFGGGSSEPKENGTEPVQDEEESQAEGGKEEEEPAQKEGDAAPEEKQETGDKPEGEAQAEKKAEAKGEGEGEKSEEKTVSQVRRSGEGYYNSTLSLAPFPG
ncbi:UNVERIFIED_CONTAM: hypothetical protein FKN15_068670 [Acipenser sinensis]